MLLRLVVLATCLLAACSSERSDDRAPSACVEQQKDIGVQISRNLDVLLVVDTSPSMTGEAARLATNLGRFAAVLENLDGGLPNIHLGVVSADVTARGGALEAAPQRPGCSPPSGAFVTDIAFANGERAANYTGAFADVLACIGNLPATGGDIEQPLEAAMRALDGSNPGNAGFLRDDAVLMVVFIGDEDDCSGGDAFAAGEPEERSAWRCFADGIQCDQAADTAGAKTHCTPRASPATLTPVADYVDFFRALELDPDTVIVTAVTTTGDDISVSLADGQPTLDAMCASDTAQGRPAPRLREFLDAFAQRSTAVSVCDADWADAFALLADLQTTTLRAPCLEGAIDLDPDTDGVQHECTVSQVRYEADAIVEDIVLAACTSADPPDAERPCYRIDTDVNLCPDTQTGATLEVLRGRENVPAGTFVRARCFTGCQ